LIMALGLDQVIEVRLPGGLLVGLAETAIRCAIVIAVALVLHRLLRRAEARVRRALWVVVFVGILVLPIASYVAPAWHVGWWPSLSTCGVVRPAAAGSVAPPVDSAEAVKAEPGLNGGFVLWLREAWVELALAFWAAGVVVVLGRLALGIVRTERIARCGAPPRASAWHDVIARLHVENHLAPDTKVLEHADVRVPFTYGFLRPVIVLPAQAESWSPERQRLVLLHECSHIRRKDWLTQLLAQIACAVYWFNPLVWIANRYLRAEQERACDARIVQLGTRPSEYAVHLLDVARAMARRPCLPVAGVMLTRPGMLERRLRSILEPGASRRRAVMPGPVVVSAVAAVVAVVSVLAPDGGWDYTLAEHLSLQAKGGGGPWCERSSFVSCTTAEIPKSMSRSIASSIAKSIMGGLSGPSSVQGSPARRAQERARKRAEDRVRRRVEDRFRQRVVDRARRRGKLDVGPYTAGSVAVDVAADVSVGP
jgi:beta-lactamase regulating signal transducer with metallopeptidase domain